MRATGASAGTDGSTILVADDHPVVRTGLQTMLNRGPGLVVVAECADGHEAITQWAALRPTVGLIDLRMPRVGGIEAMRAIRQLDPAARLIAMTTLGGDEDVYRALHAGASGYLLKDCGAGALLDCVQAVLRGQRYLDATSSASLAARIVQAPLTSRESEVLSHMARGLSNKRIARQLGVAEGTIKTHVKSLLEKLDVENRTHAIQVAATRGLVALADPANLTAGR